MQYRLILVLLVFLFSSQPVLAIECSAVFPDGLQNNTNVGTIEFGDGSVLAGSVDGILASNNPIINNGVNSCDTQDCASSGVAALSVPYAIPGGGSGDATLTTPTTLAPGNYNNYTLNDSVVLTLSAGDYIFNDLTLTSNSEIVIAGTNDKVRIFIKGNATINAFTRINFAGESSNLLLYFSSDTNFGANSNVKAFVYSDANISLSNLAELTGAISANNINLVSTSFAQFESTIPEFGDFCESQQLTPTLEYRFDECSYAGLVGDVVDQTGSFPGQPFGDVATEELGQVGRFIDISAATQRVETLLTLPASYSVSVWFKKPTASTGERYFVLGSVAEGGDLLYLDGDNDLRWGVWDGSSASDGTYEFNDLDNNWHHLALVYNANQTSLYIDGVFIETVNIVPAGTLTYIATSVDNINGQGFRAPLDEFLLFDRVLTAQEIATIYSNQSANNNYDGTTRAVVNCAPRFEAGRITLKDTQGIISSDFDSNSPDLPEGFTQICFDTPFAEPPAVFTMPTRQTSEFTNRLTLRIRNVTETGFQVTQVRSQAANAPNGYAPQTVDFIAVKKGNFQLGGNQAVTIGAENVTDYQARSRGGSSWQNVALDLPSVPAVLTSLQTMNNEFSNGPFPFSQPFMAATVRNVQDNNFQLAIDQGETNTAFAQAENIAYLAITQGTGVLIPPTFGDAGVTYEAIRTSQNIRGLAVNDCRVINFTDNYASSPLVIGSQNTRNGSDGGWLERCSISSNSVGFNITEDGIDNDTNHVNERAGVLALGGTFADYTNSCGPTVDHFRIDTLNGEGLTCDEDIITIKACANADCSILTNDAVDVDFIVKDGATNEFTKTVTIVGGQVDVNYRYTKVGDAGLTLTSVDPQITDEVKCADDIDISTCLVNFKETGFRFINTTGDGIVNENLPVQLSGKPSNVGFNATTNLAIEAITTDGNETPSCQALLVTGESIEMGAKHQSPETRPSSDAEIVNILETSGTTGTDVTLVNNASSYDYTEVPLDFGDDSQNSAKYVFKYDNAGSVLLNARYQLPDEEGNPSGNYITGTSNPIIVRPFGFFIDAKGDTGSSDNGTRPVYKKAGEEFTVELKAVVWQSNDDLFINSTFAPGNDGIPDIGADLSNNAVTDNFGNENTPETATISHQVVAPLSGVGTLTSSAFVFNNGVASNEEVSFSEVGIIRLTANLTDRSYLGAGDIQGNLPLVGRFTPAYFQVTSISDGALKATCSTNETLDLPFVYSGQKLFDNSSIGALGYASTPTITIKARNQDGDLTQNYIDDFFKLTQASFKRLTISPTSTTLAPDTDATQLGKNDNLVRLTANLNDGEINNTAGMITYSYNSNDNFSYLREENSEINPFTADIDLSMVAIIDDDAIATVDFDGNAQNGLIVTLNPVGNKRIRFGRAQLENSYGPETANLAQTLSVKFFKDDQYILKGEVLDTEPDQEADTEPDQCTPYNSNKMSVTNIDLIDFSQSPPNPDITDVSGKFIDEIPFGITRAIELTATGAGNTGSVCVSYNIVPWLKYRWATDVNNLQCPFNADDVDNSFNDNPFGIATFGLYRGNDRIIYQREIE